MGVTSLQKCSQCILQPQPNGLHSYIYIYIYIYMNIYIYICSICVYIYLCIQTYTHVYIYIYIYVYKYLHICMCFIHIQTYICTYKSKEGFFCNIAIYMNMRNVHIYIYIEHRNLKIRKHVTTSQFTYETFYYL